MTSAIEDFGHIASRLSEIEREKLATIADMPLEDAPAVSGGPVTYSWMGIPITATPSIDDIYCGFLI